MFDIGFSELALIALIGLLVLGPKRLPEVARTLGSWLGRLRAWIANVKQDLDREINSEELAEFRKLKAELEETKRLIEQSASQTLAQAQGGLEPPTSSTAEKPAPSIAPPAMTKTPTPQRTKTRARRTPNRRARSPGKKRGRRRS